MELRALQLKNRKFSLFLKRRFLPIFLATFLGTFNDNLLRSGLVILIAYAAHNGLALPAKPEILVTICSAILMMPFILFSSIAGSLADKYEKSRLVMIAKAAEIAIMCLVFYGFSQHDIVLLMCLLFLSGTHTTFYSPVKFSILPDHLSKQEMLAGNGFVASGSYLAVLFGLIAGGLLVETPGNVIGYAWVCGEFVHFAVESGASGSKNSTQSLVWNQGNRLLCLHGPHRYDGDFRTVMVFSGGIVIHGAVCQLRTGRCPR